MSKPIDKTKEFEKLSDPFYHNRERVIFLFRASTARLVNMKKYSTAVQAMIARKKWASF